jgi:hypothetical protein
LLSVPPVEPKDILQEDNRITRVDGMEQRISDLIMFCMLLTFLNGCNGFRSNCLMKKVLFVLIFGYQKPPLCQ